MSFSYSPAHALVNVRMRGTEILPPPVCDLTFIY